MLGTSNLVYRLTMTSTIQINDKLPEGLAKSRDYLLYFGTRFLNLDRVKLIGLLQLSCTD